MLNLCTLSFVLLLALRPDLPPLLTSPAVPPQRAGLCQIPNDRRDGIVVRASASQSIDLGFTPFVESYQKTFKNGIHSFSAWHSAFRGDCGEQAGKFAGCVLGKVLNGTPPPLCGRQVAKPGEGWAPPGVSA